jgi:hypothetical protein
MGGHRAPPWPARRRATLVEVERAAGDLVASAANDDGLAIWVVGVMAPKPYDAPDRDASGHGLRGQDGWRQQRRYRRYGFRWCESASNLDLTPVEHQIVEAEAELSISGVFDRRSIATPSFFSNTAMRYSVSIGSKLYADSHACRFTCMKRCCQR